MGRADGPPEVGGVMGEAVVLHVLEALEGGTARHLVDLVRHVDGISHLVAVPRRRSFGVTDQTAARVMRDAGASVHLTPMRRQPWAPGNAVALATLFRLVDRYRPDIVHGHSSVGGALARLVAGRRPVLYTPHGIVEGGAYLAVERLLGRRVTRLVAVSPSEGDLAARLRLVPPGRITVIPNGVDIDPPAGAFDLRARLGLAPATPLVGTVARLVPQKAPVLFVRACAIVAHRRPDVHFLLIGSGPLQSDVDVAVRAGRLAGRFHQLRSVPGAAGLLDQLQVVLLLSRFEGGPYLPLEAMRAGTPIVVCDVVGNRDAAQDGVSGFVVPPDDPVAAADRVVELLGHPQTGLAMGLAGRRRVAEHFDVGDMGRRTKALYDEVLLGR